MSKTVVIHQPDFLPYIGFFHRFLKSDLWVVLDQVQFVNKGGSWHYRDRIKTPKGAVWLSISVQKTEINTPINKVLLSNAVNWKENNLNLIKQNYSKAPYFKEIFPFVEKLYSNTSERMMDFNLASIDMLTDLFDIRIEKIFASDLNPQGAKSELLIDILKKAKAEIYFSGVGAKNYMNDELFRAEGIDVVYQDFIHPVYPQLHGDFIPYLSSIDLFFNCGIEESRKILRKV